MIVVLIYLIKIAHNKNNNNSKSEIKKKYNKNILEMLQFLLVEKIHQVVLF